MRFASVFFARVRVAAKAIRAMTMIATITITTIRVVIIWGLPVWWTSLLPQGLVSETPLVERFPEDGRVTRATVGIERVAGDHADRRPAEPAVEPLGGVAGDGVEDEQRLALSAGFFLGSCHQCLCDAALACAAVDEQLGDLTAVRLIRREGEQHLHRPDDLIAVEGREQQPATGVDLVREAVEGGAGVRLREGVHVADRRAARDAVGEHCRETVELCVQRLAVQPADLDRRNLGHALKCRTAEPQCARWSKAAG